ncbi:threonine synthase [Candidatus Parcubacteria bacterium]|nr:threonine synthase [Candidatus Parcubacteria bacterium]
MKFISLTDPTDIVSFEQALTRGIALNSGLYLPEHVPRLTEQQINSMVGAGRQEIARTMLSPWLQDEIPPDDLDGIIAEASTFDTPVIQVGDKQVLELFRGPTMAFKDIAARYLAALISYFNRKADRHSTVLVATSGDTGGAIAHGFGDVERVRVVVLYPKDRVSKLQKEQLRRVADNVWTLEIEGSFDDCQQMVKQALGDQELSANLHLTSANSISMGRLLPQMIYYAYAYGQINDRAIRFVVPSGNLGNLTGCVLARAMGVPIDSFLAANNANDALYRYLMSGKYEPRETIQTLSSAMDIGAPNNLTRLIKLFRYLTRITFM